MSRDDVLDRAANNMMLLSQDIRNGSKVTERSTEALRTVAEAVLAVKREVYDALGPGGSIDQVMRSIDSRLGTISTQLGIIGNDAHVVREKTGTHQLQQPDAKVGLVRAFGELKIPTQIILVSGVILTPVAGAILHWVMTLGGK